MSVSNERLTRKFLRGELDLNEYGEKTEKFCVQDLYSLTTGGRKMVIDVRREKIKKKIVDGCKRIVMRKLERR